MYFFCTLSRRRRTYGNLPNHTLQESCRDNYTYRGSILGGLRFIDKLHCEPLKNWWIFLSLRYRRLRVVGLSPNFQRLEAHVWNRVFWGFLFPSSSWPPFSRGESGVTGGSEKSKNPKSQHQYAFLNSNWSRTKRGASPGCCTHHTMLLRIVRC